MPSQIVGLVLRLSRAGTVVTSAKRETSVHTSEEKHYVSTTKPSRLMLFGETIAVYCENHTEHINTRCGQRERDRSGKVVKDTTFRVRKKESIYSV
jgi:hypothetical protein